MGVAHFLLRSLESRQVLGRTASQVQSQTCAMAYPARAAAATLEARSFTHRGWVSRGAAAFGGLLLLGACAAPPDAQQLAYQERYAKAKALFEERCKTAGVVIHRTVKDVEGIELTKIRQPIPWGGKEYFDPMYPEAAMAGEVRGDNYIKQFLMSEFVVPERPKERSSLGPPTQENRQTFPNAKKGYSFVEYLDLGNRRRYRCTPDWSLDHSNWVPGQHNCAVVQVANTRYALDYEDIVHPDDRAHWIAGTKLKVIDKETGEVIAQLTKFVWDSGFGGSSTGRWPWQHADGRGPNQNCPYTAFKPTGKDSRYFVDTVLIPKQGD